MLSSIPLLKSYRSDKHDIIRQFYIPCLRVSSTYKRSVGFFSSSSLSVAAKGLHVFLNGGGRMQLIASPFLSENDIEAINKGYANRRELEEQSIIRALEGEFEKISKERLGLLAWLIEYNRLDIKIAVLRRPGKPGVYHEKLGIFDDGKDFVAFTGSPNESVSGLVNNFECIDVFCSWRNGDIERAQEKIEDFNNLWENETSLLQVYDFPEAARKSLLRLRSTTIPDNDPELTGINDPDGNFFESSYSNYPVFPIDIQLFKHQLEALKNWFKNKGRGTLKMATGSGKTITALAIAEHLYREIGLQCLIIIVPYRHLVMQWKGECNKFGLDPILCFESRKLWANQLQASLYSLSAGKQSFLTVITTNNTLRTEVFQNLLPYFPQRTLIIGDEAHNLGTVQIAAALPQNVGLRLALSATPEQWFDDSRSNSIFQYFGPILKPEFTLADALKSGVLVKYYYQPIFVELTDDEIDKYLDLSRKINKLILSAKKEDEEPAALKFLLLERARLIATAKNKLVALRKIMKKRLDTKHTLFYCGDGSVEESASADMIRHIEAVCKLLGSELGYRIDSYTAETTLDERSDLRERFTTGEIQGLVAIRCLDEGVDIPPTRTAFILASSENPRQFIQRRGRILRRCDGKESAEIFDFIVVPPDDPSEETFDTERQLVRKELQRYIEFATLAENAGEVLGQLVDIQRKYQLMGI